MNTNTLSQAASFAQTMTFYVFIALFVGVGITTIILWYHWKKYSLNDPKIAFAQLIYFLGLCLLSAGALMSIIA